jgi:hypothetical protein
LPGGALVGTGAGGQEAATVGLPVAAGTGVAVPGPPGRELATGRGAASTVGGAVGEADGAAPTGAGVPVAVGAAAGAAAAVSRVACALAVCDAAAEAWPPPAAEAAPEHPVSARPAATPSAAPIVTRGVFSFIRTCMLLDVVPTMTRTPGNTSRPAKSCPKQPATFPPLQPYKDKRADRRERGDPWAES